MRCYRFENSLRHILTFPETLQEEVSNEQREDNFFTDHGLFTKTYLSLDVLIDRRATII